MVEECDLISGRLRLLEVDHSLVLPSYTHIRLLITSADVLHGWFVPSLGLNVHACPGRLSEVSLFINREGVFYGQCSEICGVNHGFMPIRVYAVPKEIFRQHIAARIYNTIGRQIKTEALVNTKLGTGTDIYKVDTSKYSSSYKGARTDTSRDTGTFRLAAGRHVRQDVQVQPPKKIKVPQNSIGPERGA